MPNLLGNKVLVAEVRGRDRARGSSAMRVRFELKGLPHSLQKLSVALFSLPQYGHRTVSVLAACPAHFSREWEAGENSCLVHP